MQPLFKVLFYLFNLIEEKIKNLNDTGLLGFLGHPGGYFEYYLKYHLKTLCEHIMYMLKI